MRGAHRSPAEELADECLARYRAECRGHAGLALLLAETCEPGYREALVLACRELLRAAHHGAGRGREDLARGVLLKWFHRGLSARLLTLAGEALRLVP